MTLTALAPSQELIDLVGTLGGHWHGRRALARCPAHADRTPSLSLRQGRSQILVHCFAGCHPDEVLRALARIRPSGRFAPPPAAPAKDVGDLVARIWQEAVPIAGTPAERYWTGRGLDPVVLDLRYHPRCPKKQPEPVTRFVPALLAAIRTATEMPAIQRIFLDLDQGGYSSKMMLGSPADGSWRPCEAGDTLALAEGIETAAAFTQIHKVPCWSTITASRLDRVRIPAGVGTILVAADNGRPGRRAGFKAARAYQDAGHTVRLMPPPARFGDWADVLVA